MRNDALGWAQVTADLVVVATPERAWAHAVVPGLDDPFARPMARPVGPATVRRLLDGAIAAAAGRAPPGPPAPPLTPLRWVWRLAGYHCTTHATPPLMTEAARRFAVDGRDALADWAETKAREEAGHDALARRDLEALGYDAAAVVEALVPPAAQALVAHFGATVREAADPIGCVGYAYVLERLAVLRDAGAVATIQAALPVGVDATRCLRVHSAVGSDAAHVEETVALVATLTAGEQTRVTAACFATALRFHAPAGAAPSDEALAALLAPLRRAPSSAGHGARA